MTSTARLCSVFLAATITLLLATVATVPLTACGGAGSAASAAATCLGSAASTIVKADGVTIVEDIYSAVVSGGATLPALLTELENDGLTPLIACATQFVDSLLSTAATAQPPTTTTPQAATATDPTSAAITAGLATLHAEMAKRGIPRLNVKILSAPPAAAK